MLMTKSNRGFFSNQWDITIAVIRKDGYDVIANRTGNLTGTE